jgi:hypothetical protein
MNDLRTHILNLAKKHPKDVDCLGRGIAGVCGVEEVGRILEMFTVGTDYNLLNIGRK